MNYDEAVFQKFRALAVTNFKDIKIGDVLYSNFRGSEAIVVGRFATNDDALSDVGNKRMNEDSVGYINWFIDTNGKFYSLNDNNVEASYNPWLLFRNEEDRDRCVEELKVSYNSDEYYYDDYDPFDDWLYDPIDFEEEPIID